MMTDPVQQVVNRLRANGWGTVIEEWLVSKGGPPGRLRDAPIGQVVDTYLNGIAVDALEALDLALV